MTFALIAHNRTVATGGLAAILEAGLERGLVLQERYPARRTGDDVVRQWLVPGVRIEIVRAAALQNRRQNITENIPARAQ